MTKKVRAWAEIWRGGDVGKLKNHNLLMKLGCGHYHVFPTKDLAKKYGAWDLVEVEIRPLPKRKK